MTKNLLILILFFSLSFESKGDGINKDSTVCFFPDKRIFPSVFLDPLECQTMGGSYLLFQKGEDRSLYSTVNPGFIRPVLNNRGEVLSWEFNFGAAIFSQFDLVKKADGTFLAGLMNVDFKISADYSIQSRDNIFRIKVFHISSHLGDDYVQRHGDTISNDKSDNYEQIDLTYMRKRGDDYFYLGAGEIYTRYVFRKRLSLQAGGLYNFRETRNINFFTGADIKILAENRFTPDIRTAFGISINRKSESLLRIWAEYYTGQLPYSTIDYGRVNWLGLAMNFNIF
jgi:hypothetical protein